ncbi:hypothetical protein EMN47_10260 [Prolixibacteraceae bacterium JC049]|nr:hypothetical protein [Prolixibacteraceae bacterium JC049]
MKRYLLILTALVSLIACEPRIELDESQWENKAEITNMFIYRMQVDEVELSDGTKTKGVKKVTVSTKYEVDSDAATVTITLPADVDRSALSCYIYHTGESITPLENAPVPGELSDWSSNSYKFRVNTVGAEYKDWTINIIE